MSISDPDQLRFSTTYPTDKIGTEGEVSYSVSSSSSDQTRTITNPLGYKCLPTMAWSLDNTNFYPPEAALSPSNTRSANIAVSDTTIYFYLYNNSGSNVTFYIKYALDTIE